MLFYDNSITVVDEDTGKNHRLERVMQAYSFSKKVKTPSVGKYWVKIDFENQMLEEPIKRLKKDKDLRNKAKHKSH